MLNEEQNLIPKQYIRSFILGGKSEFVLLNTKTENHFTYKVEKSENSMGKNVLASYYVRVQYEYGRMIYAGYLTVDAYNCIKYFQGTKGQFSETSQSIVVLLWFLQRQPIDIPDNMQCMHLGKCGRCGRLLTEPESIRTGFGPTCLEIVKRNRI